MTEEEWKDYKRMLEKLEEARRANETPEQGMQRFKQHIFDTSTSRKSETSKQMQRIIDEELKHIPDWPEPQNELRMEYNTRRMYSLRKGAKPKQTAKEVLEECLIHLKGDYPDFQFKYDEDFFNKSCQR